MNIICVVDHGLQPDVLDYQDLGLVVFAGPNHTADDVIAQATRWWAPSLSSESEIKSEMEMETTNDTKKKKVDDNDDNKPADAHVFVVTSDGELKQRCMRSNQPGRLLHNKNKRGKKQRTSPNTVVKVFGSPQLVSCLEALEDEDNNNNNNNNNNNYNNNNKEEDNNNRGNQRDHQRLLERELAELEQDIRGYQTSRPPWNSGQEQLEANERGPWKSKVLLWNEEDEQDEEEQERPPTIIPLPKKPFSETT